MRNMAMWLVGILACVIANYAVSAPKPHAPAAPEVADARGTDKQPLVVKELPVEKAAVEVERDEQDRIDKKELDRKSIWLTEITLGVLILQLIAFVAQARFMWRSIGEMKAATKATEIAANAAMKSADALPNIERAYVFTELDMPSVNPNPPGGQNKTVFKIKFMNHGKTPAIVTKMRAYFVVDTVPPQALNAAEDGLADIAPGLVIPAGSHFPRVKWEEVTNANFQMINAGQLKLYCVGLIQYDDVLGTNRETSFCWNLVKGPEGFEFRLTPKTLLNDYN